MYVESPSKRARCGEHQGVAVVAMPQYPQQQLNTPMDMGGAGGMGSTQMESSVVQNSTNPTALQDGDKIVLRRDMSKCAVFSAQAGAFRCLAPCCQHAPHPRCFEARVLLVHWGLIGEGSPESLLQRVP
jgi:hypothetical protein